KAAHFIRVTAMISSVADDDCRVDGDAGQDNVQHPCFHGVVAMRALRCPERPMMAIDAPIITDARNH
ncbi:MAG TPA: hypothetical protein VMF29_05390, partial [Candidatus Edwardsbacteria bacterium]|nr:hypothetical protein [Candidatus Edwardsbacteria bacterium]